MHRPGRREPLGLDKHMAIPKQFAAVGRKDQLDSLAATNLHQSCADAPQLVHKLVNHLDARQSGGCVICRPRQVRRDHPLAQQFCTSCRCVAYLIRPARSPSGSRLKRARGARLPPGQPGANRSIEGPYSK